MKVFLTLVSCLYLGTQCWGQSGFQIYEVPVFKNASDSILYITLQASLRNAFQTNAAPEQVDSLGQALRMAEAKAVGRKKVYQGSNDFLPYDSLKFISDYGQVKNLTLSIRALTRLPADLFECKNLETLELVNTRIKRLGKLKKLQSLKTIHLLNNTPTRPLKLSKSISVTTLLVRMDRSNRLPRSYKKWVSLEKIDLANCGLEEFPQGLTRNHHLKELRLGINRITLKSGKIELIPSLEKLELQGNGIEHLPDAIRNLPNLTRLTLAWNAIRSVSPAISELKKLEELSFYRNNLTSIPDGVYSLSALREIDLYFNKIERLDSRIEGLKNIEVLYLSNNHLISLPDNIGSLSSLKELYLSNNRISELPLGLTTLRNLKVLRVNDNLLIQVPKDLPKLTNLENLDISNNQMIELPAGLSELPYLKLLVIANNPWEDSTLTDLIAQLRSRNVVVHSTDQTP